MISGLIFNGKTIYLKKIRIPGICRKITLSLNLNLCNSVRMLYNTILFCCQYLTIIYIYIVFENFMKYKILIYFIFMLIYQHLKN